jgi:NADPH-dependent 2,4-dienoyl-CoA reductase/sulfur reductase-like enzyme
MRSRRHANIRVCSGTRVIAAPARNELLLEDAERGWRMQWKKLILCTGARELLLPFPGWTLPGVTGAGGLQALIKAGLPVEGERIVIAGSGPLLLAAAATARAAGAKVVRIAEQATLAAVAGFAANLWRWPGKAAQSVTLADPQYRTASRIVSAQGDAQVESVRRLQGGREVEIACDRVACGFGLTPNTQLGRLLGCALTPKARRAGTGRRCAAAHQPARHLRRRRMHRLRRQRARARAGHHRRPCGRRQRARRKAA